jgi:hypothetical protein
VLRGRYTSESTFNHGTHTVLMLGMELHSVAPRPVLGTTAAQDTLYGKATSHQTDVATTTCISTVTAVFDSK